MWNEQWKEENEIFHERHDLTIERIRMIGTEQTAAEQFCRRSKSNGGRWIVGKTFI